MSNCTVVDTEDRVLDYLPVEELLPGDIYRITGLWLHDGRGQVLIAQRSATKANDPNRWGPAVAGTVEQGETYESNIYKEATEELGLENKVFQQGSKLFVNDNGYGQGYFVQLYLCEIDELTVKNFLLQPDEVQRVRWISLDELRGWVQTAPAEFTVSFSQALESVVPSMNDNSKASPAQTAATASTPLVGRADTNQIY